MRVIKGIVVKTQWLNIIIGRFHLYGYQHINITRKSIMYATPRR